MPFTGPGDDSLPDRIKKLSEEKRNQWVGAFNGRFADCEKGDATLTVAECESSAFAVANAAIKGLEEGHGHPVLVKDPPDLVEAPPDSGSAEAEDSLGNQGQKFGGESPDAVDRYYEVLDRQIDQEKAEYTTLGGTDAKACANCQWFIAPMRCAVVRDWPEPILPTGLSNLWRERVKFEPEPLEVTIVGGSSHHEDEAEKQETKTEGGVDFKPSDYAVVPDASKPSGWKLRLAEGSSGNITVAQVARAITAMQPSGFRGRRVQLTSEQKSQAVSRTGGAIGKTGGTDEQKQNLRDRLDKVKEARTVDRVLGALKGLLPTLRSREPTTNGFKVVQDTEGNYRWVAWATNRWRDRDNPPEIFEQKAHEEFVRYLDASGRFPEAWLWHTKGSRWGTTDWADYIDGFLVVSGTVDRGMEHVAQSLAKDKDLGVSHGFKFRYSNEDSGIIGWYRTVEVSPLPAKMAANPWTSLEVIQQEVKEMNPTKRQWLVDKLGEEKVATIEDDTAKAREELEKAGVDFKEGTDGPESLEEPKASEGGTEGSPETKPPDMKDMADAVGQAAVKAIEASEGFKGILVSIKDLGERLKKVEKSDDEKVAALVAPKVNGAVKGHKASEAEGNAADKEEAETLGAPSTDKAWWQEEVIDKIIEPASPS